MYQVFFLLFRIIIRSMESVWVWPNVILLSSVSCKYVGNHLKSWFFRFSDDCRPRPVFVVGAAFPAVLGGHAAVGSVAFAVAVITI
jgi:hypothetical protein